ncbi:pimeloyl-ACP methyl ester esterase BioH [Oceaniserpentilla sp. 4NH20-0058]|uniref:alpha/beta fold hydrolase n=1 Tax=Oceaniserpentilla sp. 4NH20-0058 TaxID=3127660 RepID=UPI0031096541
MTLAVHKWGDENLPAIFCIHGWASNAQVFQPLAALFKDHYHFIAVDLPGFGDSHYQDGDYQLETLMGKLLAVAPEKSSWLGWSLGGMLAVQGALDSPDRIEKVMTLCSNAKFIASKRFKQGVPQPLFNGFMESISDVRVTLRRFAALTVVGEQKDMLQSLKWLQQNTQVPAPSSDVLKASLELLAAIDNQVAIANIQHPCLHMLATDDAIVPHQASQVLNKLNEKHLTSFVPNASHACLVTQPQLVANGILTFMQGLQNA